MTGFVSLPGSIRQWSCLEGAAGRFRGPLLPRIFRRQGLTGANLRTCGPKNGRMKDNTRSGQVAEAPLL